MKKGEDLWSLASCRSGSIRVGLLGSSDLFENAMLSSELDELLLLDHAREIDTEGLQLTFDFADGHRRLRRRCHDLDGTGTQAPQQRNVEGSTEYNASSRTTKPRKKQSRPRENQSILEI